MFIKLTNAAPEFKNKPFMIKKDLIVSAYSTTVDREDGTLEDITLVFVPPHGTWQVYETIDQVEGLLNSPAN